MPDRYGHSRYKSIESEHVFELNKCHNIGGHLIDDKKLEMTLIGSRGDETDGVDVMRIQELFDHDLLWSMGSDLPHDERDHAVGRSGEARVGNQVEGNDFAELIDEIRLFHVDRANFFAD